MQQPETQNEWALQLQLNSAEMNLVESSLFFIKSLFLIFWLCLVWILSTKGMQLDGDAEQNHSFLSPRWGRLASAGAFLALWPFPSLLFSTHVLLLFLLFFSFFFYVPCIFCAMPCCLICIFLHLVRLFPGAGPLLPGRNNKNEMASLFICYTLQLKGRVSCIFILIPNP